MGQLANVVLGVLELAAPEKSVVRTDLDADPAVHAERVVDGETVKDVALARTSSLALGREGFLVRVDVDAPVGALATAEHADGAVLFLECDYSARARGEILLLVRILDNGVAFEEVLERDTKTLEKAEAEGLLAFSCSSSCLCCSTLRIEHPSSHSEDQQQRDRDQDLPRKLLELVLSNARERRSDPEEQEDHDHRL